MKYILLILMIIQPLWSLLATPLCEDLEKDLKELQRAESNMAHPQTGEKLLVLQDQYDSAIADYTIYKGIDELRTAYLKFNDDVTSINIGNKDYDENKVYSELKTFVTNLFGANRAPKVRDLQKFRNDLRNGMAATAGILMMEDLIDRLFVSESLQQKLSNQNLSYTGNEFLTELKIQCDRVDSGKSAYESSPLCQELYVKDEKGRLEFSENGNARLMVLGFFDAYKALIRGEEKADIKEKLTDYKRTLLSSMPKSSFMQQQLQLVKDVDVQLGLDLDQYRNALRTNPNQTISSQQLSSLRKQVTAFTEQMQTLSVSNNRLLGARERTAMIMATRDSKIKTQFGNLQEVVDGLASKVDKTQDNLISSMMSNYEINRARRALAANAPIDGIRERDPEDEFRKAFNSLEIPSCKNMTFYQNADQRMKNREALYQCLSDMNKNSNTSIAERIKTAKDQADAIKKKIAKIEKEADFENFDFLKKATIKSIKTNCRKYEQKACRTDEHNSLLLDGEQHLSYLTNSVGEILSLYNPEEIKAGGLSTKEMEERAEYCRDSYYSKLAPTICQGAKTHEKMVTTNKSFSFDEDADGMKSDPTTRPTNAEIFISASKAPVQNMVPFLLQYRNTSSTIGPMTDYAKQQKSYNYVMTEYWKEYYEKFPTVGMWGTSSLYPTYYNPLSSMTFNYGSTPYYGGLGASYTGQLTGYNFSN